MRILTLIIIVISALSAVPTAHATYLKEALESAYENNPNIRAARKGLESRNELVPQSYSEWLPNLSFQFSRGREKEDFNSGGNISSTTESRRLNVTQPIFDGFGSVAQAKRAYNLVNAGRSSLIQTEQEVLLQTVAIYMQVVQNEEILDLSKNNEKVLKEQLDATKERFDLGENTRTDVAQSEARLSRARSDRITAEGNLITSKATYKRVVGNEPVDVKMPKKLPKIPDSLKAAIDVGLNSNPSLREAKFNERVAQDEISIFKSRVYPSVNVTGSMRRDEGAGVIGSGTLDSDAITLNLTIPLYQSGSEYSRVRQAKKDARQRLHQMQETRNQTIEDVTSAWEDIETARSTIASTSDAVKAAEVALDGVRQEAQVGSRTTLDILDAEQELFVQQVNLVRAQTDEVVAIYNLLSTLGGLRAKKLDLDVKIYDPNAHLEEVEYKPFGF